MGSGCAEKTNTAFEKYELANATTATYSFFLYDLCDVYLELLKPRFYSAEGEEETPEVAADRKAARYVLYTCLDWSFRLMHPLLPFLTEELYQRLPASPSKYESVTVAPFPNHVISWLNGQIEDDMEVAQEVAKHLRSQKTSLGFLPKARPNAFVRHSDDEWRGRLGGLANRLTRMANVGEVTILGDVTTTPKATISDVVNDKCIIFMEVEGLDLSVELEKLKKKVINSEKMVKSYEAKIAVPGYEEKVPANIRDQNAEKLAASKVELEELNRAVISIQAAMKAA